MREDETKVARWYLVHTYSGKEQKVLNELKDRIKGYGLEDRILEVLLPVDYYSVVDKKGKRKIKPVKVFPGYILVKMIMDDESWYVVRNTPGVLGFVGPTGKPTPISEEEIKKIIEERVTEEKAKEKLHFDINDRVRILVGPFKNMEGVVEAIDEEKGTARVVLKMFGREMPVEIQSEYIQKV
ncbi:MULTISPECIES: transcription termination/antitermination protein NusG [Caldisericum]|jgi:transcriptional antiterminator NusG|uniref:Transcription termination/antitermination protein NusG n=1 Tax=Caldisericum exile TaxID=693075 RepID=A0A2J6WEZ1_9BACT|nr:MAG: transcription termination/antitermination factor NusG [Caldisericum exile]